MYHIRASCPGWLLLGSANGKHRQQMRDGRRESLGYFFLLPPGLDSLPVALEPPGAGTRLVPEKGALRDSEPTLAVSWDISWALPAIQTGFLLPHSVPGALPQLGHSSRSGDSEVSPVPLSSPPLPLGLCFPRPSLREQLTYLPILHSSSQHYSAPGLYKEQAVMVGSR